VPCANKFLVLELIGRPWRLGPADGYYSACLEVSMVEEKVRSVSEVRYVSVIEENVRSLSMIEATG